MQEAGKCLPLGFLGLDETCFFGVCVGVCAWGRGGGGVHGGGGYSGILVRGRCG